MRHINRSALVSYDPERAFNLVDDVANYASFLPWCTESRVDSRSQHLVEATLVLAGPGVKQSFSTANQRFPYERIELRLLNGPFNRLDGLWTFDRLGDEGCKITLDLSFELNNGLLDQAFGRLFGLAADRLVTAFTDQLDQHYERL